MSGYITRSRWCWEYASPFRDAEGLTQGAIVLVQDRTEMRRAVELQREFIANASHELRTPVASLQATVDTLVDGAKDDPGARDRFLETLSRETVRLSSLLTNLLDLSRLEASGPVKKTWSTSPAHGKTCSRSPRRCSPRESSIFRPTFPRVWRCPRITPS